MVGETLQKIKEAETKAEELISLSKEEAQRIISNAQLKARELIERAKEEAIREANSDFEISIEQAQTDSKRLLDETENEIIVLKKRAVSNLKAAADFILMSTRLMERTK